MKERESLMVVIKGLVVVHPTICYKYGFMMNLCLNLRISQFHEVLVGCNRTLGVVMWTHSTNLMFRTCVYALLKYVNIK